MKKKLPLANLADAFTNAEQGLQFDSTGVSPGYELHPLNGKPLSGKPQSPAQHASVKKAAAASVAKRKAGKMLRPRASKSLFGF